MSEEAQTPATRMAVMAKIESFIFKLLPVLAEGESPVIKIPKMNPKNIEDNRKENISLCPKKRKRFAIILKLLNEVHALLDSNSTATKRDLFYRDVSFYESQTVVDQNIDAIARILDVPRWHLNVVATSKGLVAGDLTFLESRNGVFVDCRFARNGVNVPAKVHEITNLRSSAECVVVVEKDAVFQQLLDDGFLARLGWKCIAVTGKGYGDLATRQLLHRIRVELGLPVFAVMDADPHGLDIFASYTIGSASTMYSDLLTVPDMQLIGVLPEEIASFKLTADQKITMSESEKLFLANLLGRVENYRKINEAVANFIHLQALSLQANGFKAEIEALYTVGEHYLVDKYLPNRILQHLQKFKKNGKKWKIF